MNDNTKKYLIISGVAIVIFWGFNKWLVSKKTPTDLGAYSDLDVNAILSKGSTGDEVSVLQKILIQQYGADLGYSGAEKNGVDGEFGSMTENALLNAKNVKEISLKKILTNK